MSLFDDLVEETPISYDDRPIQMIADLFNEEDFDYFRKTNDLIVSLFDEQKNDHEKETIISNIINSYIARENDPSFYACLFEHFINFRPKQREIFINILDQLHSKYPDKEKELMNTAKFHDLNIIDLLASGSENFISIYQPNTVEYFIKEDDIDSFQDFVTNQYEYDMDSIHNLETNQPPHFVAWDTKISLLNLAAFYGSIQIFKYLFMNNCKTSPDTFAYAISSGVMEIIHICEQKSLPLRNSLKVSVQFHQKEITEWIILNYGFEEVSLWDCINYHNYEAFFYYCMNIKNHHESSFNGRTPLSLACEKGHLCVVKYLIEKQNARKESRDKYGMITIHVAASYGNLNIVKYLIEEQGIDVNIKDNFWRTPLHWAALEGHLDVVKYLVEEQNASLTALNKRNETPMDDAQRHNKYEVFNYLAPKTPDVIPEKDQIDISQLRSIL